MDIRIWDSEVRGKIQEWSKLYLLKYNKGLAIKFISKIAFSLYVLSPLGELDHLCRNEK